MIRPLIVVLAVASTAPAQAAGPSFSCAAAATPVEQSICGDPELSRLDRSLEGTFRRALAARPDDKATVLDGQRRWLKDRGRLCPGPGDAGQSACLVDLYTARIADLGRLVSIIPGLAPKPVQTLRIGPDGRVIER